MRIRLRISNDDLVEDLLEFLRRCDCEGSRLGVGVVEVGPPHEHDREQAQMELAAYLRAWQAVHPGVDVERVGVQRSLRISPDND